MTNTDYRQMLEKERVRINQLETELAQHRALLEALTVLAEEVSDGQAQDSAGGIAPSPSLPPNNRLPAYVRKESLPLLRSIKDQALSADAIVAYCHQAGVVINRDTVLLRLGLYRRNYAMVKTVRPGLYQLTEKGQRYMDEHYPETASITIHRNIGNLQAKPQLPDIYLWQKEKE